MLCRSRDHRFLGASKVLFEATVGEAWSAYTDHNPVEVRLAKSWVVRAPPRTPRRARRPYWVSLRGSGDAAQVARSALATELDRRVADEQPTTWPEVVSWVWVLLGQFWGRNLRRILDLGFVDAKMSLLLSIRR